MMPAAVTAAKPRREQEASVPCEANVTSAIAGGAGGLRARSFTIDGEAKTGVQGLHGPVSWAEYFWKSK